MKIIFKTLLGHDIIVEADSNDSILDIKNKIARKENFDFVDGLEIVFAGKKLGNDTKFPFSEYIEEGSIHLITPNKERLFVNAYKNLPEKFRQFLSATTQGTRHEMGHISTEEYWHNLSGSQRQDLTQQFAKLSNNESAITNDKRCVIS